jgi:hypothetical protein
MPAENPSQSGIQAALVFEIARAMALPRTKSTLALIMLLFGRAAQRFSELVQGLEREVARSGPAMGARWLLPSFVAGHVAHGTELIPPDGPLLIVSNHPASYDGLVISAHVDRPDYRVVIGEIPLYRYLPHVSRHALFSPPARNTFGRMQTIRNAIRHLKDGGALLIFPRGGIEPDPASMEGAAAEFNKWSRSLEILLERVPQTRVLVTMVSGVIAPACLRHPITWFRRSRPDRQRLAFMYQIIRQVLSGRELFGLIPRITFGELLSAGGHRRVLSEIEQAARRTLDRHMSIIGRST